MATDSRGVDEGRKDATGGWQAAREAARQAILYPLKLHSPLQQVATQARRARRSHRGSQRSPRQ